MASHTAEIDQQHQARASWIGVLSRANLPDIEMYWKEHEERIVFDWLRKPQTGLVMVRGRAGGTGGAFNLGEMTVTRCALRLPDGNVGYGYVQGRNRRHVELAAILDAMLQQDDRRAELMAQVIEPLRTIQAQRRMERSRKAAATKVEFFTLVRGENPV